MEEVIITPFEKTTEGQETNLYTIKNSIGASITLCNYGAVVHSIKVPDRNGKLVDVLLGYKHISEYETADTYFGATVGRCANRICKGKFVLNGKKYQLNVNNGVNHLHGGIKSFSRKVWNAETSNGKIKFSLVSLDNEENYPGEMKVTVTYNFDENNNFTICYEAVSNKDTLCNMTSHCYFNLDGHESNDIKNQHICINADYYIPVDDTLIPTGEILKVDNTAFDFRKYKKISDGLKKKDKQIDIAHGFDHTFVLNEGNGLKKAASAYSDKTGIMLTCKTTQNGMQLYTGNYVNVVEGRGKNGVSYGEKSGFCFETQNFPDAINHDNFPSVVLKAGDVYREKTVFSFGINK